MSATDWPSDIVRFWFEELTSDDWWGGGDTLDADIKARFFELWEEQKEKIAGDFVESPDEALAAVLLFDQFPRNMFRGTADAFVTDHLALQIAKAAVDSGHDKALAALRRAFLYMPYMHSEDRDDQTQSLLLYSQPGLEGNLDFARSHYDVIAKFDRFPHRNKVLGRAMREGEQQAIDDGAVW